MEPITNFKNSASFFNPYSSKHQALKNFKILSFRQKVLVTFITALTAPIFCLLAVMTFRLLVEKFCAAKLSPNLSHPEKIKKSAAEIFPTEAAKINPLLDQQPKINGSLPEKLPVLVEDQQQVDPKDIHPQKGAAFPLIYAIVHNDRKNVAEIIQENDLINTPDEDGNLPLHCAIREKNIAMVNFLFPFLKDINAQDGKGRTALSLAAEMNHREIIQLLLDHEANPNIKDKNGDIPLELAIINENFESIDLLMPFTEKREFVLIFATLEGKYKVVEFLLQHNDINPNLLDQDGNQALHYAAEEGFLEILNLLLLKTANLNKRNLEGKTALHLAVENEKTELVKALLKQQANFLLHDKNGGLPIHYAILNKNIELIELLINLEDEEGKTALHLAVENDEFIWTKHLLKNGANANLADREQFLPIHYAVLNQNRSMVRLLTKYTKNINAKTDLEETPLTLAASLKDPMIVDLLLQKGADSNICDFNRMQALHHAAMMGHLKNVKLLWNETKDKYAKDTKGNTAHNLATIYQKKDVERFINEELHRML